MAKKNARDELLPEIYENDLLEDCFIVAAVAVVDPDVSDEAKRNAKLLIDATKQAYLCHFRGDHWAAIQFAFVAGSLREKVVGHMAELPKAFQQMQTANQRRREARVGKYKSTYPALTAALFERLLEEKRGRTDLAIRAVMRETGLSKETVYRHLRLVNKPA